MVNRRVHILLLFFNITIRVLLSLLIYFYIYKSTAKRARSIDRSRSTHNTSKCVFIWPFYAKRVENHLAMWSAHGHEGIIHQNEYDNHHLSLSSMSHEPAEARCMWILIFSSGSFWNRVEPRRMIFFSWNLNYRIKIWKKWESNFTCIK